MKFAKRQDAAISSGFVSDYQKNVGVNTILDRQYIMGYCLLGRLPALHDLGRSFTVCDQWFSSWPGPTWPNPFFALSGTSSGRVFMPERIFHLRPEEVFVQDQFTVLVRDQVEAPT